MQSFAHLNMGMNGLISILWVQYTEVTPEIAMAEQETHSAIQKFGVSFLESVK